MKFLSLLFLIFVSASACKKEEQRDSFPFTQFIQWFSKERVSQTGLKLRFYGPFFPQPEEDRVKYKNEVFGASYDLSKDSKDIVSVDEARCILVYLVEDFLKELNRAREAISHAPPLAYDRVGMHIDFLGENTENLINGSVSKISILRGKIRYETFEVQGYIGKYPARGKHVLLAEEPYGKELEIVQARQNNSKSI